jgi:hypothetical protein
LVWSGAYLVTALPSDPVILNRSDVDAPAGTEVDVRARVKPDCDLARPFPEEPDMPGIPGIELLDGEVDIPGIPGMEE